MMGHYYILDENKNAVAAEYDKYILWLAENRNRHVGHDFVNGFRISTVFLSANYNFWGYGRPVLFETMIFDAITEEEAFDGYQKRCSTWQEAEKQHLAAVEYVVKHSERQ